MICGRDCKEGDSNCNGYCTGKVDAPPTATPTMILDRKRLAAYDALREAIGAWYKYYGECEVGDERTHAAEVYERIQNADRR
jgi:hypothetical protein